MNKLSILKDRFIPIIFGVIFLTITAVMHKTTGFILADTKSFDKIIDATINFISIVLGFIGVLIGLLFSIKDTGLVKKLFEGNRKRQLKLCFMEAIVFGILLVGISMMMYVAGDIYELLLSKDLDWPINNIMFYIWTLIWGLAIGSSFQIIYIMINSLFGKNLVNPEESNILKGEERIKFQNEHTK